MQRLSYHDNFSAGILTLGKRYFQIVWAKESLGSALLCEDLGPSSAVSFRRREDYRREKTEVSTEGRRENRSHVTQRYFSESAGVRFPISSIFHEPFSFERSNPIPSEFTFFGS